jgi:hypothetical protein
MIILDNGRYKGTVVATGNRIEAMVSFHESPPVVLSSRARGWLVIDLLPGVLTHVSDKEVSGESVETKSPRVPKPRRPDFSPHPRTPTKGLLGN